MYCGDIDQLKKRIPEEVLVQLTDDQNLGVIDEAVILEIGAGVDELIDGKLRGVYELPLATVPGIIKAIATDLMIYELHSRRVGIPESIEKKYTNQMKILDQIHSGAVRLGIGAVITPPAETATEGLLVATGDKMFSPAILDRY
jgi:phage gp36-like protein